jgi:hypothetical protein
MSIIIKGGVSGDLADVTASNQLQVALPTTAAPAGYAKIVNPDGDSIYFGNASRLRTGEVQQLFHDPFDLTTLNTNFWTSSTSTMTFAVSGSTLTLNSGSSISASTYCILTSNRYFQQFSEFALGVQIRAKLISQANSVMEFGLGLAATTAAPTDGVFFRVTSSGSLIGVANFNGTETVTASLLSFSSSDFYTFRIKFYDNQVLFEVGLAGTGQVEQTLVGRSYLGIPVGQSDPTTNSRLPLFMRVYNTASAPSSAPQLLVSSVTAFQDDLSQNRLWGYVKAGMGHGVVQSPVTTYSQTQQWANTTNPTAITPNNTASTAYTTLGGLYSINAPATGTSDLAIFAFQVPTGYQFVITDAWVSSINGGAAVATTSTVLEWAIAVNASAASLATADGTNTWQPRRLGLGVQAWAIAAAIGATAPDIVRTFGQAPLICEQGRYIHVLVKPLIGTATASQVIEGIVTINGYWE